MRTQQRFSTFDITIADAYVDGITSPLKGTARKLKLTETGSTFVEPGIASYSESSARRCELSCDTAKHGVWNRANHCSNSIRCMSRRSRTASIIVDIKTSKKKLVIKILYC